MSEKLAGSRLCRTMYVIHQELGYYSEGVREATGGFSVRERHVPVNILKITG